MQGVLRSWPYSLVMERRSPRQSVKRPAKIYVEGADPLTCFIRDISRGGANLHVFWKSWSWEGGLPNTFELEDTFSNTRRTVHLVWVRESGVGVRFADEAQGPVVPKPAVFGRRRA